jgi:ribosomal protein S18 acetylase RimI-like enzyme
MAADTANQTAEELSFTKVTEDGQFPDWASREDVESFLFQKMQPYNDNPEDITRGVNFALGVDGAPGGFVMLANLDGKLVGVLVMLRTGMQGFIPDNILLYVGVDPDMRGKGIGRKLIDHCIEQSDGDVKLHVEYDNPAKRLYERIGFTSKYAEMRFTK